MTTMTIILFGVLVSSELLALLAGLWLTRRLELDLDSVGLLLAKLDVSVPRRIIIGFCWGVTGILVGVLVLGLLKLLPEETTILAGFGAYLILNVIGVALAWRRMDPLVEQFRKHESRAKSR